MDVVQQFKLLLEEVNAASGLALELDDANGCTFPYNGTAFNVTVLPESGYALLYASLGDLGDDVNAPGRAAWLLEANDAFLGSGGFTLALDEKTNRVFAIDRRLVSDLDGADTFAGWLEMLDTCVGDIRRAVEVKFPYVDDDPEDADEITIKEVE